VQLEVFVNSEPYFALAVVFIMGGVVGLTKTYKSSKEGSNANRKSLTTAEYVLIIIGGSLIVLSIYLILLTYYFIGFAFIFSGILGLTAKFKFPRERYWDDLFESDNAKKIVQIIDIVVCILYILFAVYLIVKGIFDPGGQWPWIHF